MNGYLGVEPMSSANTFMIKVYNWMIGALVISGITAYYVSLNSSIFLPILKSGLIYPLFLLEIGLVIAISWGINKISYFTALVLFIIYSIISGLTLSSIFLVYTLNSIFSVFFYTSAIFGFMSFYGYTTKADMTTFGSILYMGLFGLIISSIINFFIGSELTQYILSWAGVIIFTGLVAYDTNKLKEMSSGLSEGDEKFGKTAILGALTLYLDFVNLFLYLLRLFGSRK